MKNRKPNTAKITEKEHWIYIDNHLPTDIHFVKTVQNAKNLRQVLRAFQMKACGIYPNYALIIERWKERISRGNSKLDARLRKENISLDWNIQDSPVLRF